MITANELAKKTKELRDAQKIFFKTKDWRALEKCKKIEKEVDTMVDAVLAFQHPTTGNLFENEKRN